MSKEEEIHNSFLEYLMALSAIDSDADFLAQVEPLSPPLEDGFWDNLKKEEEKKKATHITLGREGLAIPKPKNPDTGIRNPNESSEMEDRLEELEEEVKGLSNFVNVLQHGPKGDKGQDGTDGEGFNLTEEDIKNAVKEGVIEGMKELLSEKI